MTAQSTRYLIVQRVFAAVAPVAASLEADALCNPSLPINLKGKREKVLFVLDRGDRLIDQVGQREKRRSRLIVGALAVTAAQDADADALHFAVRGALKSIRPQLSDLNAPIWREVEIEPEVKEIALEGSLLLSAFEAEYMETYPAA